MQGIQASIESEIQRLSHCFDKASSLFAQLEIAPVSSGTSGESKMTKAKFFVAAALLATAALAPNLADARHNRYHLHNWGLPYPISYLHNYGPGLQPGSFAYYDGPSTVLCRQGAAAYIGQDRRRHPCY
jgi:hypothetical protein